MRLWKWLGLAGVAGVAATGVIVVRDQRRRAQMTPDDVRRRLHDRIQDRLGDRIGDRVDDETSDA